MAIFGVGCSSASVVSRRYFMDVASRLQSPDIMKNPFNGRVKRISSSFYVVDMTPVLPNLSWVGWIIAGVAVSFAGLRFSWGLFAGLFVASFGIFWSRFFLFGMLKLGIRRAGYTGRVKLLPPSTTIRGLI